MAKVSGIAITPGAGSKTRLIRILRIFRVMSFSVESYGFRRNVSWVRQIVTEGGCGGQNGYEKKYGWMLAVFFFPSCSLGCSVLPLAGDSYGARALSCFSPENLSSSIKIRFSRMNRKYCSPSEKRLRT